MAQPRGPKTFLDHLTSPWTLLPAVAGVSALVVGWALDLDLLWFALGAVAALALPVTGCPPSPNPSNPAGSGKDVKGGKAPVFSLAWSEYPSWSVFGVASDKGLIDGRAGHLGRLEERYGVDIELKMLEYG